SDMYLNSTFDPIEIGKEREVIKEEVAMYLDQPHQQVQELLNATLWPNQPLGRSITGTVKTLDAISRDALVAFNRLYYGAGATVIAAAGKLTHRQLLKAIQPHVRHFGKGTRSLYIPATSAQTKP